MKLQRKAVEILLVDDDPEDRMLIIDALSISHMHNKVRQLENGVELIEYLRNEGKFADSRQFPTPGIVLLDLNMPKKDGREALKELREDPRFKTLPVVVLTTSKSDLDISRTYDLGANSFITKPVSFTTLIAVMQKFCDYWFEIVELPPATAE